MDDYIEREEHSEVKHECLDGEVYAMARASCARKLITRNLGFALHSCLRGGLCQVFLCDKKLHFKLALDDYFD